MDRLLDEALTGPRYLARPEVARIVAQAIRDHDQTLGHYQLHSFVVMANHVHLLITPKVPVPKLMHSLKRFTARECNRVLSLTGHTFWQGESYDRVVRDDDEFRRIQRYIEWNPVKAGLVEEPREFPWSYSEGWLKAD